MPEITVDLRGKGVIVTGAGGSIASACALALARCGASLALNDRDPQALERLVGRVRETGVPVTSLVGDVSDYDRVQQMATQGIAELGNVFGGIDHGVGHFWPLRMTSESSNAPSRWCLEAFASHTGS